MTRPQTLSTLTDMMMVNMMLRIVDNGHEDEDGEHDDEEDSAHDVDDDGEHGDDEEIEHDVDEHLERHENGELAWKGRSHSLL